MKKLMIGFMLLAVNGSVGLAQTNFYSNVTTTGTGYYPKDLTYSSNAQKSTLGTNDEDFFIIGQHKVKPRLRVKKGGTGIPARDADYCGQECPHHLLLP